MARSPGARSLLVIDDEPQIRRFLGISLRAQGYEVSEAATGREGLEALATAWRRPGDPRPRPARPGRPGGAARTARLVVACR